MHLVALSKSNLTPRSAEKPPQPTSVEHVVSNGTPLPEYYQNRTKQLLHKAVPPDASEKLFTETFEKIDDLMGQFANHPSVVHKQDPNGNAVSLIPGVGSLKKTISGFEMSVLQNSYWTQALVQVPIHDNDGLAAVPLGRRVDWNGINVTFEQERAQMHVKQFQYSLVTGANCDLTEESQVLLDLNKARATSIAESFGNFSQQKNYGQDLSQVSPSKGPLVTPPWSLSEFFSRFF